MWPLVTSERNYPLEKKKPIAPKELERKVFCTRHTNQMFLLQVLYPIITTPHVPT